MKITTYDVEDILHSLTTAEAKPEKVKIWADALRADDLIQTTDGVLYDEACGGLCVLGVAFATFFPEDWGRYILDEGASTRFANHWDHALRDALGATRAVHSMPFWAANDEGVPLTEIADVLDQYVTSKV